MLRRTAGGSGQIVDAERRNREIFRGENGTWWDDAVTEYVIDVG